MRRILVCLLLAVILAACSGPATVTELPAATLTVSPTQAATATVTPNPTATATVDPRLPPDRWQEWPVVPQRISPRTLEIFQRGQLLGNNPQAFSKVGDGEISTAWFLVSFDLGPAYYELGPYSDLQVLLDLFEGSFERSSMAARRGFTTQMVLDPANAEADVCNEGESSLDCEVRLHRPALALISMGTNQVWDPQAFETGMRGIIERLIELGVVPILSTKGDNLEGDQRINLIIARLAYEYDIPLWNFWLAIQPLPDHGLQADNEHLTYNGNSYLFDVDMQTAWPWRNLTALQTLRSVAHGLGLIP